MTDPVIHIPAVMQGEFGIPRSRARMEIDLGRVLVNGRVLNPGEHDLLMSDCLAEDGNMHLSRRKDSTIDWGDK